MKASVLFSLIATFSLLSACKGGSQVDPLLKGKTEEQIKLIQRGRAVYLSQCSACHNADPRKVGVLAPEIHDSTMDLLTARVLRGEYPVGYQSKMLKRGQTPTVMPAMPFVEPDLPAIFAFLQAWAVLKDSSQ